MDIQYLSLADYFLIAEGVLGVPAEVLVLSSDINLADSALNAPAASYGGHELIPDFIDKAAVLCVRVCNNHALIDGSRRVAYVCLREFVTRNGYQWFDPPDDTDGDETVKILWDVAAGQCDEPALADWLRERIVDGEK